MLRWGATLGALMALAIWPLACYEDCEVGDIGCESGVTIDFDPPLDVTTPTTIEVSYDQRVARCEFGPELTYRRCDSALFEYQAASGDGGHETRSKGFSLQAATPAVMTVRIWRGDRLVADREYRPIYHSFRVGESEACAQCTAAAPITMPVPTT